MIVFFGDSITRDWPLEEVGEADPVNAGIAGETTGQMRARFARDVVARRPEVVHILGGINDIAENRGPVTVEETAGNLQAMVAMARAERIGVVLGLLLPCTIVAKRPYLRPRPAVRRLNGMLRAFAAEAGIVVADYFDPLAEDGDRLRAACTADGLHPNGAGYALMTAVARRAIETARRKVVGDG